MTEISPFSLRQRTALITGGGTGIGLAIATSLVALGASVILAGRREPELAAAAKSLGERAAYYVLDVTDLDTMPGAVEAIGRNHGAIDLLVNNAGVHLKKPFVATSDAELLSVLRTNVVGALALARACHPQLSRSGTGSVVFVSSIAALFGLPDILAYSTAKAALGGAVRALAVEWGAAGIRVNAVASGVVATAMSGRALDGDVERRNRLLARTPCIGSARPPTWAGPWLISARLRRSSSPARSCPSTAA